jgi:acetyl esterase/lipase
MLRKLLLFFVSASAFAQLPPTADWAVHALNEYEVYPNLTYVTASNYEAKLDVYKRRDTAAPRPTIIWIHGGGWIIGTKEASLMSLMPWFEMGWNVVNVEYRLGKVAPPPAAVEDAQCALRYVALQAKTYGFDMNRLVVSGDSAGGHLALAAGMIPESEGLARQCTGGGPLGPELPLPKVAAIINWYGIPDVADLLDGDNRKTYAVQWFGSLPNRVELARRISPLTYVRPGLPPILTIQGDADPVVPYQQSLRLRDALTKAGVQNELVTVPGGGHGGFKPEERTKIYLRIRDFLNKNGLGGA